MIALPRRTLARQARDILADWATAMFPGRSLKVLGLHLPPVVAVLPTALPEVTIRRRLVDRALVLADHTCLDLEVQTGRPDLTRFLLYAAQLHAAHRLPIGSVVLYTDAVGDMPAELDIGCARFRVRNVYMARLDGARVLVGLQRRLAAAGHLVPDDAADLAFVALMDHGGRPRVAAAREAVGLAEHIPDPALATSTVAAILGFAECVVSEADFSDLVEVARVSRLATILWREAAARGRAEGQALGRAEGQALGRAEAILGVLQARFGTVPDDLSAIVCGQTDPARLEAWVGLAATCSGLAAFAAALPGS